MIVCGWSGEWDHALRAAFFRAANRRYSIFWTARGTPGDGAQQHADRPCELARRQPGAFATTHRNRFTGALCFEQDECWFRSDDRLVIK